VLLPDQDRSLWDRELIAEGQQLVRACLRRDAPGPYQLQAAIAAVHSEGVTDWQQVHDAVATATDALGTIELVANVAGGAGFGMGAGPLLGVSEKEWDAVIDLNLKGTWIVSRAGAARHWYPGLTIHLPSGARPMHGG
jgi:NAD(P)-dependent dehydrogenase (short-subunit alcohol dehydrogenase family)